MPIFIGDTKRKIEIGSVKIKEGYIGNTLFYQNDDRIWLIPEGLADVSSPDQVTFPKLPSLWYGKAGNDGHSNSSSPKDYTQDFWNATSGNTKIVRFVGAGGHVAGDDAIWGVDTGWFDVNSRMKLSCLFHKGNWANSGTAGIYILGWDGVDYECFLAAGSRDNPSFLNDQYSEPPCGGKSGYTGGENDPGNIEAFAFHQPGWFTFEIPSKYKRIRFQYFQDASWTSDWVTVGIHALVLHNRDLGYKVLRNGYHEYEKFVKMDPNHMSINDHKTLT